LDRGLPAGRPDSERWNGGGGGLRLAGQPSATTGAETTASRCFPRLNRLLAQAGQLEVSRRIQERYFLARIFRDRCGLCEPRSRVSAAELNRGLPRSLADPGVGISQLRNNLVKRLSVVRRSQIFELEHAGADVSRWFGNAFPP